MSVNSGGFQIKTTSGNSTSTAMSIYLNSTAFTMQLRLKDRAKRTVSSSTTIMRIHMLRVVLLNASPIRAVNCYHNRHILPQKRLPTTTSIGRRTKFMTISIT
ncbi:hypothetical protein CDAR_199061 [Caerostris darwini]|uniref:Uncharacterized protein n=1 Tax=Caerostris darwini TaxID=1538125 RepID=A0AAV4TB62_9ARAC|nr:hypothetical protein CDAR_199061 [Caerostris darwini]